MDNESSFLTDKEVTIFSLLIVIGVSTNDGLLSTDDITTFFLDEEVSTCLP